MHSELFCQFHSFKCAVRPSSSKSVILGYKEICCIIEILIGVEVCSVSELGGWKTAAFINPYVRTDFSFSFPDQIDQTHQAVAGGE